MRVSADEKDAQGNVSMTKSIYEYNREHDLRAQIEDTHEYKDGYNAGYNAIKPIAKAERWKHRIAGATVATVFWMLADAVTLTWRMH